MSRMCLAALLFSGMAMAAEDLRMPAKTFELKFTNGLTAEFAKGNPVPIKTDKVKIVDAPTGKAARLPQNGGFLLYGLAGNFPKDHGTLLLWMKPDWSPKGLPSWNNNFKGLFSTAKDGGVPGPAKGQNGDQLGAVQDGMLHYHWYGEAEELPCWYMGQEGFSSDVWRCYAFTWDERKGLEFFLNGRLISKSSKSLDRSVGDANSFYLGSAFFMGGPLGFEGCLARASIYDGALSGAQIQAESWGGLPYKVCFETMTSGMLSGVDNDIRIKCSNFSGKEVADEFRFVLKDRTGKELQRIARTLTIEKGAERLERICLNPPSIGSYVLEVFEGGILAGSFDLLAISSKPLSDSMPLSKDGVTNDLLLETIDCAQELGPDKYRDDGNCKVEKSALGQWREAFGGKQLSGFVYQLSSIKHPGKPHWLEIEYPDNGQRHFYVAVFPEKNGKTMNMTGNLNTIGVLTGGSHPVTNTMQKKRLLFWPDAKDIAVGCYLYLPYGYAQEKGPALSKISLYEIEGALPRLEVNSPTLKPKRMIGVWQEDPAMPKDIWFNRTDMSGGVDSLPFWNEKWTRMASYLHYTGQNLCDMEVFNYVGDASAVSNYAYGWDDLGALILQREGLGFLLQMQDMALCSHIRGAGGLAKAVGVENLSWTMEEALAKGDTSLERFSNDDVWSATGKTNDSFGYPLLNPLHPKVQAGYLKLIRDYAQRFSPYESFKGISFLAARWSNLFYRDITEGYEDWSIKEFESETGIKIPVPVNDQKRFSKRYAWLMKNAKEDWLAWRAGRIAKFYAQMALALRELAPGREIVFLVYGDSCDMAAWPSSKDLKTVWLERGVDFSLLADIEGFKFPIPQVKPNYDRVYSRDQAYKNMRYYCFSPELAALQQDAKSHLVALIQHSDFEVYVDNAPEQVKSYFLPRNNMAESKNCHTAFSIPHPDNKYELEYLARMLADFNPEIMLNGWWGCPDNGAIDVYQPFYRAFRSVPMIEFKKVPGAGDPVQLKYGTHEKASFWVFPDNDYYIMLVNRECYPVSVDMDFETNATELRDMVENVPVKLEDGKLRLMVKPYQVRCFKSVSPLVFKKVAMEVPPEVVADLRDKLAQLDHALASLSKEERRDGGLSEVVAFAKSSMDRKEYSRLHYLFQCAVAEKYLKANERQ